MIRGDNTDCSTANWQCPLGSDLDLPFWSQPWLVQNGLRVGSYTDPMSQVKSLSSSKSTQHGFAQLRPCQAGSVPTSLWLILSGSCSQARELVSSQGGSMDAIMMAALLMERKKMEAIVVRAGCFNITSMGLLGLSRRSEGHAEKQNQRSKSDHHEPIQNFLQNDRGSKMKQLLYYAL